MKNYVLAKKELQYHYKNIHIIAILHDFILRHCNKNSLHSGPWVSHIDLDIYYIEVTFAVRAIPK